MSDHEILEQRVFKLLPANDIGFSKPALTYTTADGKEHTRVADEFSAPLPELARAAGDPGWWTITVWLPVGAQPVELIPDPSAPSL